MKKINEIEDAANIGSNPFTMAGRMTNATADAMQAAAENQAGAMSGFVGMGMVGVGQNTGFSAAQNMYNAGAAQVSRNDPAADSWKCSCGADATGKFCSECGAARPAEKGWKCSCGEVNQGKFCRNCGEKKPEGAPLYRCDKCGWQPEDPNNPPKFCPECGDAFNENDKI